MGFGERLKSPIEELEFALLVIAPLPLASFVEDVEDVPKDIDFDLGEYE